MLILKFNQLMSQTFQFGAHEIRFEIIRKCQFTLKLCLIYPGSFIFQMACKYTSLTDRGLTQAINDNSYPNPVLQIIDFQDQKKKLGEQALYYAEISDGLSKLRCYFSNDILKKVEQNSRKMNNQIIMLTRYGATVKSILIYDYQVVVEEYQEVIGTPISYKEYLASGNSSSNNIIRPDKIVTKLLSSTHRKPIEAVQMPTSKKKIDLADPSSVDMISDLYPDMMNWKIYCRVNKVNYSEFTARSGNHTKLLAMELMDRKGSTIRATIFGDFAERMSKVIQAGDTYTFSKGVVKMDNYKRNSSATSSEYTIILSELSKIQATSDDSSIKNPQSTYVTVNDLKLKEANAEVDVVGIIKEIKHTVDVQAKGGNKSLKKRTLLVCDPINKVQIDAVLWNQLTDIDERLLYKTVLLSEFKVHIYNSALSINSSFRSKITELTDHPMKEYQSKVVSENYQTISYRRDESNMKIIKNVKEIETAKENLTDDGSIWSDLRVYLNRIKDKAKKTYDGCPFCKKTVQPDDTICGSCGKSFPKALTRYILTIELSDYTGSIWTTAHDDFAERIFKMVGNYPAEIVKNYSEKQFDDLVKSCLFQEFKIKVVTKFENTTNGKRIKHNVAKLFPLDHTAEAKNNLDYIRKRI